MQSQYNGIEENDDVVGLLTLGILAINETTSLIKATVYGIRLNISIRKVSYIIG